MLERAFESKPQEIRNALETLLRGMLAYDPSQRMSLIDICKSPWQQELLCYNEDLRELVRQEKGDESWLRQAPPAAAVTTTTKFSPQQQQQSSLMPPSAAGEDETLEHSNNVVEIASEIPSAVPSVQPPGYRAMAGHVLLWCRDKMTWMLKPFTQSLANIGQ